MIIRPAEPGDAMAVARMHRRTWQIAYRSLIPDHYLDNMNVEERAKRYDFGSTDPQIPTTLLAIEQGEIVGFASTSPSRDADLPQHGELCGLYVDPGFWGRRIGAELIAAARRQLLDRGFRSAYLWVLSGNTHAQRFYRIDQWQPDGAHRADTSRGFQLDELRYRRPLP
jgi:ribosomal protein S18 acetylase RimI-like enzyme